VEQRSVSLNPRVVQASELSAGTQLNNESNRSVHRATDLDAKCIAQKTRLNVRLSVKSVSRRVVCSLLKFCPKERVLRDENSEKILWKIH
jgi:hypothetical protein